MVKNIVQNPELSSVSGPGAAYILTYTSFMISTSLHNPNIKQKDKMTLEQVGQMLKGANKENDTDPNLNFDPAFLKELYDNLSKKPFDLVFTPIPQGYEISSSKLLLDPTFKAVTHLHDKKDIITAFPSLGDKPLELEVHQANSWSSLFTGYTSTICIKDKENEAGVSVQVYKPSFFSRLFFGESSKVVIQPDVIGKEANQAILELAGKIAASFHTDLSHVKSTYHYQKEDMEESYKTAKMDLQKIQEKKEVISH